MGISAAALIQSKNRLGVTLRTSRVLHRELGVLGELGILDLETKTYSEGVSAKVSVALPLERLRADSHASMHIQRLVMLDACRYCKLD